VFDCKPCRELQKQRGLTNAWVTGHEHQGAEDSAAAQDAFHLGHAHGQTTAAVNGLVAK
jgi:hypothetical protein